MSVRKLLCGIFGHKWHIYAHSTGYYSYDIEQAGHCYICGADTHEDDETIQSWTQIIRSYAKQIVADLIGEDKKDG